MSQGAFKHSQKLLAVLPLFKPFKQPISRLIPELAQAATPGCPPLTAARGVGAGGAVLAAQQLRARLARLGRLGAAAFPEVELLPVGLLAAPQHRHGAPRLLHHLHDAVQRLREEHVLGQPRFRDEAGAR